jgi:hypothetical protein
MAMMVMTQRGLMSTTTMTMRTRMMLVAFVENVTLIWITLPSDAAT